MKETTINFIAQSSTPTQQQSSVSTPPSASTGMSMFPAIVTGICVGLVAPIVSNFIQFLIKRWEKKHDWQLEIIQAWKQKLDESSLAARISPYERKVHLETTTLKVHPDFQHLRRLMSRKNQKRLENELSCIEAVHENYNQRYGELKNHIEKIFEVLRSKEKANLKSANNLEEEILQGFKNITKKYDELLSRCQSHHEQNSLDLVPTCEFDWSSLIFSEVMKNPLLWMEPKDPIIADIEEVQELEKIGKTLQREAIQSSNNIALDEAKFRDFLREQLAEIETKLRGC